MAKIKGIDISYWQEKVDFKKVAADGVKFAILREGYRKTLDKRFIEYVKGCQDNGIAVMVYHFIYTDNATIQQNAQSTYDNIKKAGLDPTTTWIAADLEYDTWVKNGEKCTKAKCTQYTKQYLEALKKLGCKNLMIYANNDYYKNYYNWLELQYPVWLADYSGDPDYTCVLHQYTSSGKVNGINGKVDMDWLFDESMLTGKTINTNTNKGEDTMTKTEKAIQQMEAWAKDNSHGYDQIYRWGEKGDYDCSAAVIQAWQNAGVPVKTNGATYTGNMLSVFKKCGFVDITAKINKSTGAGLQRGDVLLNTSHHTAMYCGNGQEVEASINEKGTATGGKPGDQTGKEFLIRSYRNYPWTHILRYPESGSFSSGTKKSVAEIAQEVINGKWGNGDARKANLQAAGYNYDEVQKKVNELLGAKPSTPTPAPTPAKPKADYAQSFDKKIARTYKTTAKLNMRTGASTSKEVITVLPKGAEVHCYGYYTGKWYYVAYKNYEGFCSSEYLK